MQRRTLGTREALEGILEDAATPTRAFASDYGYDLVSLLLPGDECSYVMATPPFIGHQQHTQQIKDDMELVCGKAGGSLDYVAGWYFKAIDFLDGNPSAQFAFVSTNSITQGQHKSPRYSNMWSNEGGVSGSLTVRSAGTLRLRTMRTCIVVIVGFDRGTNAPALYEYDDINGEPVEARPAHINGYLLDASDVFVEARSQKTGP